MHSFHLHKITRFPRPGLLMLAVGLVAVCQILAMIMVAGMPLQNTGVRDLQQLAPQIALADCLRQSTSATRHGCIRQSQLESDEAEIAAGGLDGMKSRNKGATNDRVELLRVAVAR